MIVWIISLALVIVGTVLLCKMEESDDEYNVLTLIGVLLIAGAVIIGGLYTSYVNSLKAVVYKMYVVRGEKIVERKLVKEIDLTECVGDLPNKTIHYKDAITDESEETSERVVLIPYLQDRRFTEKLRLVNGGNKE